MRPTRAVIDLARLERNWRRLCEAHTAGCVFTVLKANAYGHGMIPAARFLQGLGQQRFAVALLEEAVALRAAGIAGRILVLGPPEPGALPLYASQRVEATLPSLAHLEAAIAAAGPVHLPERLPELHLKCDTGMGRIGLRPEELDAARSLLRAHPALPLRGLCSHFADAESLHSDFAERQCDAFERWCAALAEVRPAPLERHMANSAALLRSPRFHFDAARVGYALWAPLMFDPAAEAPPLNAALEPALSLLTRVSHSKTMRAGESVGYGRTYTCKEGEVIATLPIGYGDGYFRTVGNRGEALLGGRRRPIVGTVSMDQTTISLGSEPCAVGTEVTLLGGGAGGIAAAELGAWAGTIDYEVLTQLGARLHRDYVYDGHPLPEP